MELQVFNNTGDVETNVKNARAYSSSIIPGRSRSRSWS